MSDNQSKIIGRLFISGDPNLSANNVTRMARAINVIQTAKRDHPDEVILGLTPGDNRGSYPVDAGVQLLELFADATTLGNNEEIIRGSDRKPVGDSKIHTVAANLVLKKGTIPDFCIFQYRDMNGQALKIAVTGLANPDESAYKTSWSTQKLVVTDPRKAFLNVLPRIEKEKPDILFAILHDGPGFGGDFQGNAINIFSNLAVGVPTVVVAGHYAPPYFDPVFVPGTDEKVTLLNGGYEMTGLREVTLSRDDNRKISFSSETWIPITDDMTPYPEAVEIIRRESEKAGVVGATPVTLDWNLQQHPIPGWNRTDLLAPETNFGNQSADLFLKEAQKNARAQGIQEPSFAIWDARYFRSHLDKGKIDGLQFAAAVPNEDRIVVTKIKLDSTLRLFYELFSADNLLRHRAKYPDPVLFSGVKAEITVDFTKLTGQIEPAPMFKYAEREGYLVIETGKPEIRLDTLEIAGERLIQNGDVIATDFDRTLFVATRKRFDTQSSAHYEIFFHTHAPVVSESARSLLQSHFAGLINTGLDEIPMGRVNYTIIEK